MVVAFAPTVEFKSVSNIVNDNNWESGMTTGNMAIKFTVDRYSLRRSQRRLQRGEELLHRAQWVSDNDPGREGLLERLRQRQQRLKEVRVGSSDYSRKDLADMLKTADSRPQLYRHLLLRNLQSGKSLVAPQTDWAAGIQEAAVESAKKMYINAEWIRHGVRRQEGTLGSAMNGTADHLDDSRLPDTSAKFRLTCNVTGFWIRNNLRKSPSVKSAKFIDAENNSATAGKNVFNQGSFSHQTKWSISSTPVLATTARMNLS